MYMTKEEILREYRGAKQPMKQIGILADENACAKQEIVKILLEAGETVPPQFLPKGNGLIGGKKSEPESAEEEREELPSGLPAPPGAGDWPEATYQAELGAAEGFRERVCRGVVDAVAKLLADSESGHDQENTVWTFRENVRGVLALAYALTKEEDE